MTWGGPRPGSGRKRLPDEMLKRKRKHLPASARTSRAPTPGSKPLVSTQGASLDDIVRIIEASNAAKGRQRSPEELNPFRIPQFPPASMPEPKHRMALDEAVNWASTQWTGSYLSASAAEGLLFLGYNYLAELSQRPEYRTPIETIATEMTRKWISFSSTAATSDTEKEEQNKTEQLESSAPGIGTTPPTPEPPEQQAKPGKPGDPKKPPSDKQDNATQERIKELTDFLEFLQCRQRFAEIAMQDGLFGRTHLFLDSRATDEELMTPIADATSNKLLKGKTGRNWLKRLQVIEPVWVYPTTYNATNPLAADWYDPQIWYVLGKQIHKSRLPVFIGRPVPDLLKPSYAFGGLSLSQMLKPYVDIWLTTRQSVAELIHAFSVMVLSTDLQTLLQPGQGPGGLLGRAALFNALRDNQGLMLINKGSEEFTNVSTSLSGLHELQAQAQEHMLSISRIPAVKAFGIEPSGLNATSEGTMRAFNDTIKAAQQYLFKPNLDYVIDLAQITLWGKKDPDITYEFESLVEMTEEEKGKKRKAEAEVGQIHIDTGVISPAEERKRIVSDPESDYHGLDPDDVPEPPADPMDGEQGDLFGGGGGAEGGPSAEGGGDEPDDGGQELSIKIAPKKKKPAPAGADSAMEVRVTAPLLIRLMEYAREDAKDDQDLHVVAEKLIEKGPDLLGMKDYNSVMPTKEGGAQDRLPFGQDAEWNEADHPRQDDGKFGEGAGGSAGHAQAAKPAAEAPKPQEAEKSTPAAPEGETDQPVYATKKDHAAALLEKGTTAKELMKALGWPSVSMPATAKSVRMKLIKEKVGKETIYRGVPMTGAELKAANLLPPGIRRSGGPAARDPDTYSLLEFIASKGGIDPRDGNIGDLRSIIGGKNKFIPGFGSLIRPGGLRLDRAREAAVEAGYMHDAGRHSGGLNESDLSHLFDNLDTEVRGQRVYRQGFDPEAGTREAEQRDDSKRVHEESISRALEEAGIPETSEKQRERILQIMQNEGMTDPLEAIEREAMEWVSNASESGEAERILDDIPGWDVPDDARAAPKPSGFAAPF